MDTCCALGALGMVDVLRAGIWKPRTHPDSFEGVGLDGLEWLRDAGEATGLPTAVEVATAAHVEAALRFGVSVLWIGARTTVNPFSVQALADALRGVDVAVMIKNPMHPDIDLWSGAVERLRRCGVQELGLIHRGFSSYGGTGVYRNNPMWHLAIEMKMRHGELPMFCDPSHICGRRDLLGEVAQRSLDLNFDGLILESHVDPCNAWSDAGQQVTPLELGILLRGLVYRCEGGGNGCSSDFGLDGGMSLRELRLQIDQLDAELLETLSRRMQVVERIGEIKRENNVTILQASRWDEVVRAALQRAEVLGLSEQFLSRILQEVHLESIAHQNKIMNR